MPGNKSTQSTLQGSPREAATADLHPVSEGFHGRVTPQYAHGRMNCGRGSRTCVFGRGSILHKEGEAEKKVSNCDAVSRPWTQKSNSTSALCWCESHLASLASKL